jgi:ferritin-like metal-binding protein YciE
MAGIGPDISKEHPQQQLLAYLADCHSIEVQALAQMRAAPKIAGEEELSRAFAGHLEETERHERLVRERLEALGGSPSKLKDVAGRAGGWGMVLFARVQPDAPGKLAFHAYAYEQMEYAAYQLLARLAAAVGDAETRELAHEIAAEEERMALRIESLLPAAVAASLDGDDEEALAGKVDTYLADAHALESQALQLLESGQKLVSDEALKALLQRHLEETREHERLVAARLDARGATPSRIKDAALRFGALNLGGFFGAQPDTTLKLAGFAFAFESLEQAGYELLANTAERAGDAETVAVARRIAGEERQTALAIAATWDRIAAARMAAAATT